MLLRAKNQGNRKGPWWGLKIVKNKVTEYYLLTDTGTTILSQNMQKLFASTV